MVGVAVPPDPPTVVARLKATVRDLLALVNGASAAQLAQVPDGEEWSPAMVVTHLADAEMVYGHRVRMMLTTDRPFLAPYDQSAWVQRFHELEVDAKTTMARWRALREANLRVFESLDDGEWKLSGLHAERGELSVLQVAAVMADHDRDHLSQMRRGLAER